MGLGIWSMHYTGMLAFVLPVPVAYHVPTVALSLLAAVLASGVALSLASHERLDTGRLILGSLVMGAGIATMHYTGMAAMRHVAVVKWDERLVALSVIIAVVVSGVALTWRFVTATPRQRPGRGAKWAAPCSWAPPFPACITPAWRRPGSWPRAPRLI
jgi:NO-binding membrane sensor protein with MHYT domain